MNSQVTKLEACQCEVAGWWADIVFMFILKFHYAYNLVIKLVFLTLASVCGEDV